MSSRDRRSQGTQDDNPFAVQENAPEISFEAIDRRGYGGPLEKALGQSISGKPVSIFAIHPDPMQPRRAIPYTVRQHWDGDMQTLFDVWLNVISAENGGHALDLRALVEVAADQLRSPNPIPVEASLLKVTDLAASIKRDGLANPITVVQDASGTYYLETGERRWLAYHILHRLYGDEWERIPAQRVEDFSVWRQAGENNARDNLNAIAKARQFALLLMDLLHRENGTEFQPFDAFEYEQDFYAQVSDGEMWRIPRGKGEMLINAMRVRNDSQLRYARSLLRLPRLAWVMADDFDTPMKTLRDCYKQAKGDDERLLFLIQKAWEKDNTVSWDTVLEDETPVSGANPVDDNPVSPANFGKAARSIASNYSKIGRLSQRQRAAVLEEIQAHRQWLDAIEQAIAESMNE